MHVRRTAAQLRHTVPAKVLAVLHRLLDLIAPPACLACGAPAADAVLCAGCRRALPWLRDPCPRCALPRPCARCPAAGAAFTAAWAPMAHAGPARELVLALKLRGALPAATVMAAQIAAGVPPPLLAPDAVLVPVPSSPGRRRRRGVDHARVLAEAVGRRTGRPVAACLRRAGGPAQVGRGRAERRAAAAAVSLAGAAPGRAVLVDDVHTTGATLDACARALRAAGCQPVAAVTYGRTLA